jgi:hypothetical protein
VGEENVTEENGISNRQLSAIFIPPLTTVEATFIKCGVTRVIKCAYPACIVILDGDSSD